MLVVLVVGIRQSGWGRGARRSRKTERCGAFRTFAPPIGQFLDVPGGDFEVAHAGHVEKVFYFARNKKRHELSGQRPYRSTKGWNGGVRVMFRVSNRFYGVSSKTHSRNTGTTRRVHSISFPLYCILPAVSFYMPPA